MTIVRQGTKENSLTPFNPLDSLPLTPEELVQRRAEAARWLANSQESMALLHTFYDDARDAGLPPHHAITRAVSRLTEVRGLTDQSK